ncbi:MAG: UDP-N-acetylmuramoyl-L-alanyl-D-glutamate--2,6-diaminopimelate ligase [Acidimicrobiales bacterium]
MRLDMLVAGLEVLAVHGDAASVEVTSVTQDSRQVRPGAMFCCLPGRVTDGHRHAAAAVDRGAVALLCERRLELDVAQVEVADARLQAGRAAAALHGHPSRCLDVVGITGTNGKTTTAALLAAALGAAGRPTAVVGTLTGARTTPEGAELQEHLATLRDAGVVAVAMEVSSHALSLSRVEGTWFSVAVFTNLGRDHLDFHLSREEYFAAKARLFEPGRAGVGVVNADDPYGRSLLETVTIPVRPYSLGEVSDLDVGLSASTGLWRGQRLRVPLGGRCNVANAVAAATAATELGVDAATAAEGIATARPVPGRFEIVDVGQPFPVVVDFAHTPEALQRLLSSVREAIGTGRVIVVFGCGGDRDRSKRPAMGGVAADLADAVVLTSDNPRGEDPLVVIEEIRAGTAGRPSVQVEPDRRVAIRRALAAAGPGDAVVVAGKGHETTQTVGERVEPFDDRVVVEEELVALGIGDRHPST